MRQALPFALLLLALPGAAQQLTITDAVDHALRSVGSIAAASAEADAARAGIREASAAKLPTASFGATATQYSDPMVATPIHGFVPGHLPPFEETLVQSALTASYLIYDSGARNAKIEETKQLARAADANVEVARQLTASRVVSSYASVLAQNAILQAQLERLKALDAEQKRVAQLEQAGRVPHVEALRVEAAIAAAEAERVEAAAQLDAAERALARLTELPVDETRVANLAPIAVSDHRPERGELEQELRQSPAVRQARDRWLAQRAIIDAARAGNKPQVLGSASHLTFGDERAIFENQWNAGLQFRFNFFDAGLTNARVARATAAARAAEEQMKNVETELGVSLDRAFADLEQSRGVVDSLETAVARFVEVARVERLRLDTGVGTQVDYLRAEADVVGARSRLEAARYRSAAIRAEIARIAGQLDPAWIDANLRSNR